MYYLVVGHVYGSHHFNTIVPSLLQRWKRLNLGLELSSKALITLSKCFKEHTKGWLKADKAAQQTRHRKPEVMDIYDTIKEKGMGNIFLRSNLHL
jgi:hypothetical protein